MLLLQLRQSLSDGYNSSNETFDNAENANEGIEHDDGNSYFEQPDDEMLESMYMNEDLPQNEKVCRFVSLLKFTSDSRLLID